MLPRAGTTRKGPRSPMSPGGAIAPGAVLPGWWGWVVGSGA